MSEVKYEDEKKLLTSDEFIAAAKANADKNLQIQKDTAQKVFDSTYASLERQYDEAATAAGIAKQRNLIDADTAYQRQELKYGAEQEALAAAGLSGSGMNEYRRARSYQQNREDRQMSYAEYDRALREAAYTRDQGKLAADINKMQADANADILYNDTMTGISEKELGYADLERQEIDAAYSGYLAGIEDGSLTMDQIMADSSWEKLSTEQKTAVITASTVKGLKGRIDNGESWDEIVASDAYKDLNDDGKNQVDGYHAQVEAGKTKDANAALGSYLEMAKAGWSIDSIMAVAEANGHYSVLSESDAWKSVVAETEAYADDKAAEETEANFTTAIGLINDGWTLEEVKGYFGGDLAKALGEKNAGQLQQVADVAARIKSETEGKTAQESLLSYLDLAATGKYTLDQLVAIATSLGHYDTLSKLDKDGNETGLWAQVVSKFEQTAQDNKNTETVTNINNAIANGATLEEIQGMEGYDDLDDTTKVNIEQAVKDRDNEKQTRKEQISAGLRLEGYTSVNDVEDYLASEGVPAAERAEYIAQWQSDMASRITKAITQNVAKMDDATVDMLVEGLKNGAYGKKAGEVVKAYYDSAVKALSSDTITLQAIATMMATLNDMPRNIVGNLINEFKDAMRERVVLLHSGVPTNSKGEKLKQEKAITDTGYVAVLDEIAGSNNYLEFDGKSFYKKGGVWYNMVADNGSTTAFDWIAYNEMVLGMPD